MRDFERLEELSGTVEAGLAANEVIWAVDQALEGATLDEATRRSLEGGGDVLKLLADPEHATATPNRRTTQRLLGNEMAANVREAVSGQTDGVDVSAYLSRLAEVLNQVAQGIDAQTHVSELEKVLAIFSLIADAELARANSIVRTRKEPTPWLRATTTSPSS